MGKTSTGVWVTNECRKLNIGWLLKNGYIRKGITTQGQMSWTDESTAGFECKCTDAEKWFRIHYTITDRQGNKTKLDYKIQITTVPSNLSKGEILYFVCPESGKRARVLYSAYRHHKYLHRDWYLENYNIRLYYRTQQVSKADYSNTIYFNLKKRVDELENELYKKHRKRFYKGKPTKDFQKLYQLKEQMNYYDTLRCKILFDRLGIKFNGF